MIILSNLNKNYKNFTLQYNKNNKFIIKYNNFIVYNSNYYYEYKNFIYYYFICIYSKNKLECILYYDYSGKIHRNNGPAWILYNNEKIIFERYYLNGEEYTYENYLTKNIDHK